MTTNATDFDTERQTVEHLRASRTRIEEELSKVIVGQKHVTEQLLYALFTGGKAELALATCDANVQAACEALRERLPSDGAELQDRLAAVLRASQKHCSSVRSRRSFTSSFSASSSLPT